MKIGDRLSSRPPVTAQYQLRVADDRETRAELAAASAEGDETRIAAALAAVQACYEEITITALAPEVMEALQGQHPPTEEQRDRNALYNAATFPAALIAACVDTEDTEQEWAEYTTKGPLTPGEALDLFHACWDINYRTPDPWLPKDWTRTPN